MLEPDFDRLRSEAGEAVRQPDFTTVRRRAGRIRRRRAITSSAVFVATVLTVIGLGFAVHSGSENRGAAGPAPTTSGVPDEAWPRTISVTSDGPNLYGLLARCAECDSELYVSSDGGASWKRRTTPGMAKDVETARSATLIPLAAGVVAWRERRSLSISEVLGSASPATSPANPASPEPLWITSDAGRTWRQAAADTQPRAAVPGGARPVDCDLLRISTCAIGVIDPATGRFAPSVGRPTAITVQPGWARQVNVPIDGRLWVPGLDPATNKPAVAISSDAGRTWHTHVFTDGVAAVFGEGSPDTKYLPHVAAGSGDTAYVLTYRADDVVDAHYTTDGGMTWRAGDTIRDVQPSVGFVTADGSHVVGMGTGLVAARGTGRYTPVELPGYESPKQAPPVVSHPAADRYLVISEYGPYLSADGRIWERVRLP